MEYMQMRQKQIFLLCTVSLLFFSGISFTFVIPGLKGFEFIAFIIILTIYIMITGLVSAVLSNKVWLIFWMALLLSTAGMGWRVWLEWGEFSLVEHMQAWVLIGYPIGTTLFIVLSYRSCEYLKEREYRNEQEGPM